SFAVEYLNQVKPWFWADGRRETGRAVTSSAHRLLVGASALACVAIVPRGRRRRAQTALLAGIAIAGAALAFAATTPTFWPIVLVACVLPWLPIPGRASAPPA